MTSGSRYQAADTWRTDQPLDRVVSGARGEQSAGFVWLGLRMSLATPQGRRRVLLAGLIASLAVLILMLAIAVRAAADRQEDRAVWRAAWPYVEGQRLVDGQVVAGFAGIDHELLRVRGVDLRTVSAVPVGDPGAPPGLDRFPAAGTIAASPAFAALHANDPRFAAQFPGTISELIRPDGLRGPNEVFAWIALAARPDADVATGDGDSDDGIADLGVGLPIGVVLVYVTCLILIGNATRLGSAERDRRMAALRLVGATAAQVRLVSAAEAGAIALVGGLVGSVAFVVLRPLLVRLPWDPGFFPADLAIGPGAIVLLLTLPLLGFAFGLVSQRRVVVEPLGVVRNQSPQRPRLWRATPLVIGLLTVVVIGMLTVPPSGQMMLAQSVTAQELASFGLLSGVVACLVGIVWVAPLLGLAGASALLRIRRLPVAGVLGARRVQADPATAARLVSGSAALVLVSTVWLGTVVPEVLADDPDLIDHQVELLQDGTVSGAAKLGSVDRLRQIEGVKQVTPIIPVEASLDGSLTDSALTDGALTVTGGIADCASVMRLLWNPMPGCAPDTAYALWYPPTRGPLRLVDSIGHRTRTIEGGGTLEVGTFSNNSWGFAMRKSTLAELVGGMLLPESLAPADLPQDWGVTMVVVTDGSAEAVESVKRALEQDSGVVPQLPVGLTEMFGDTSGPTLALTSAYLLAIGLSVAVSVASAASDDLSGRRRSLAVLAALGTPRRTLRRAGLVQLCVLLLPSTGLSLAGGAVAVWAYHRLDMAWMLDGTSPPFRPWLPLGIGVATVLMVLAAFALTLPGLRSASDPDALRTR